MNTQTFHTSQPIAFGTAQAAGAGALAGALETVALAASLKLPLSAAGFFALGIVDVLIMAGLALIVALLVGGAWFSRSGSEQDPVVGWSWQGAAVVFVLAGFYLGGEAASRIERGDPMVVAAALAAMPLGFAGLGYYNARYWFRYVERTSRPWGFPIVAAVGSVVLVIGSTVAFATRSPGSGAGTAEDRSAVVITVDGLGSTALPDGGAIAGLAASPGGLSFDNAVTPAPEPRSANASVITGLHPLRHQVVTGSEVLSPRFPTLFRAVGDEGWPTAGFVSSSAVDADSGLDQGLDVLDDALSSGSWLGRIALPRRLGLGGGPGYRAAPQTVGAFVRWLEQHGDQPFVAWIHLADPRRAARDGEGPDAAASAVDEAVARVREALAAVGADDRTLVVVAGTSGADLDAGLGEAAVRVPVVLDAPGETFEQHDFDAQVRILDVVNTVAEYLEMPPIDTSEGVSLLPYGRDDRAGAMSCALVGRHEDGRWLLGLRNNGVKYWVDRNGRETLYYLPDDPDETTNLAEEQPQVLAQARAFLVTERAAMRKLVWQ